MRSRSPVRRGGACRQVQGQEKRAGSQHAQGDDIHRVQPLLVEQFDEHHFGRQQDGAAGRQGQSAAMTHKRGRRNDG